MLEYNSHLGPIHPLIVHWSSFHYSHITYDGTHNEPFRYVLKPNLFVFGVYLIYPFKFLLCLKDIMFFPYTARHLYSLLYTLISFVLIDTLPLHVNVLSRSATHVSLASKSQESYNELQEIVLVVWENKKM